MPDYLEDQEEVPDLGLHQEKTAGSLLPLGGYLRSHGR